MYCTSCGTPGSGNYCTSCGARLAPAAWSEPASRVDWSHEVRYDVLVAHPDVRDLLAQSARGSQLNISAEKLLKVYDKFVAKAAGSVALSDLATVVVPIFTRMGVRTAAKQRSEMVAAPVGRTIVALLCSLAARGSTVKDVHQACDGCAIEAVLPSDIWSWEGALVVTVTAQGDWSRLDARTTIAGQSFDWGKSMRWLDHLVSDVHAFRSQTFAA